MKLAKFVGIEVPIHGMFYNIDQSLTYFIKRFDRISRNQKLGVEDFSQLLGCSRDTKYDASMEKIIPIIEKYCTFPFLEKQKLFRLVIFNFLIGNEDMHLKNFSLISRENKVELSPAYNLINTSLVLSSKEEVALPIRGKKSNLNYFDVIQYFGLERLKLGESNIQNELRNFEHSFKNWDRLIRQSFLKKDTQETYQQMIMNRWERLMKSRGTS